MDDELFGDSDAVPLLRLVHDSSRLAKRFLGGAPPPLMHESGPLLTGPTGPEGLQTPSASHMLIVNFWPSGTVTFQEAVVSCVCSKESSTLPTSPSAVMYGVYGALPPCQVILSGRH